MSITSAVRVLRSMLESCFKGVLAWCESAPSCSWIELVIEPLSNDSTCTPSSSVSSASGACAIETSAVALKDTVNTETDPLGEDLSALPWSYMYQRLYEISVMRVTNLEAQAVLFKELWPAPGIIRHHLVLSLAPGLSKPIDRALSPGVFKPAIEK